MDALPRILAKSRGREIRVLTFPITLKIDRNFNSSYVDTSRNLETLGAIDDAYGHDTHNRNYFL